MATDIHYRGHLLRYKFGKWYVFKGDTLVKGPFARDGDARKWVDANA